MGEERGDKMLVVFLRGLGLGGAVSQNQCQRRRLDGLWNGGWEGEGERERERERERDFLGLWEGGGWEKRKDEERANE